MNSRHPLFQSLRGLLGRYLSRVLLSLSILTLPSVSFAQNITTGGSGSGLPQPVVPGNCLVGTTTSTAGWSSCAGPQGETIVSKTPNYTLATTDTGSHFNNAGATAAVVLTLPASPAAGFKACFTILASQPFTIAANTGETISVGTVTSVAGGNLTFPPTAPDSSTCLVAQNATTFTAETSQGTYTLN
jgi:hypothetical protein